MSNDTLNGNFHEIFIVWRMANVNKFVWTASSLRWRFSVLTARQLNWRDLNIFPQFCCNVHRSISFFVLDFINRCKCLTFTYNVRQSSNDDKTDTAHGACSQSTISSIGMKWNKRSKINKIGALAQYGFHSHVNYVSGPLEANHNSKLISNILIKLILCVSRVERFNHSIFG